MFLNNLACSRLNHTNHPKQSNLNDYDQKGKKGLPKLGCCGGCCCSCCCFSNMAMSVADEFAEDGFIGKAESGKITKLIFICKINFFSPPNSMSNLSESCDTANPKSKS